MLSEFLRIFYFIHPFLDNNWQIWYGDGYTFGAWTIGFFILLGVSLVFALGYYLHGRNSSQFSSMTAWWVTMAICGMVVFAASFSGVYYLSFEGVGSPFEADQDVWIFALLNGTVYTALVFFAFSLLFKSTSLHSRYIPV